MGGKKHVSMALTTKLLRYGGMWPQRDEKFYKVYMCIVFLNCILFMALLSHIYFREDKDISAIIENTDHILTVASYIVTMLSILNNRDSYEKIVRSMQSLISYRETDEEDDRKKAVRRGILIERKLCKYYLSAISTTTCCFLLKPLVAIMLSRQEDPNPNTMDFPLKLVPFTSRDSVPKAAFEYVCHCLILGLLIVTIVPLDLFTFALIKYLAKQFEVLSILVGNISNYDHHQYGTLMPSVEAPVALEQNNEVDRHCDTKKGPLEEGFGSGGKTCVSIMHRKQNLHKSDITESQTRAVNNLKDFVIQHQEILQNAKKLVDLLSPIIFSHYLVSSLTICLVGYQITTAENKGTLISNCAHLSSFMLRLFVLCFLSTEVYSQSESVGRAAYEARWLRLHAGARRSLWLAMLRAQRPVCMRASQFGVVSLHMFSALVQTAYSYYNVLIKMNSK